MNRERANPGPIFGRGGRFYTTLIAKTPSAHPLPGARPIIRTTCSSIPAARHTSSANTLAEWPTKLCARFTLMKSPSAAAVGAECVKAICDRWDGRLTRGVRRVPRTHRTAPILGAALEKPGIPRTAPGEWPTTLFSSSSPGYCPPETNRQRTPRHPHTRVQSCHTRRLDLVRQLHGRGLRRFQGCLYVDLAPHIKS